MRNLLLLLVAACGGGPALGNAPRPDPGIIAGAAAATAAAATLADPDAATRKPEKKVETEKREVNVKERVTPDVLDRLDKKEQGSAQPSEPAQPDPKADGKTAKPSTKNKPPKIPSPKDFVDKHADKGSDDK